MAFTLRGSNSNEGNISAGTISLNLSTTAGDLVAVWVKHEGTPTTITVSDGTSSFTAATKRTHSNNDDNGQWFYLLSTVSTGSKTYTATFGANKTFRSIHVWAFIPTATVAFDTEALSAADASGTAATSAAFSTTGTDEVVLGGYTNYGGGEPSSRAINSVAADGFLQGGNDLASTWYRILTATFSNGAATATIADSDYILNAIALKAGAGGADYPYRPVQTEPIQRAFRKMALS